MPQMKDIQAQVSELHKWVGLLEYRVEDAEGRASRNNLRIIGLPEKSEGPVLVDLFEDWI